jgi:hypothetical protein
MMTKPRWILSLLLLFVLTDMEMVTDLGHILVTRDDQEFELKAQGWNPL